MYCQECGAEVAERQTFCHRCGARLARLSVDGVRIEDKGAPTTTPPTAYQHMRTGSHEDGLRGNPGTLGFVFLSFFVVLVFQIVGLNISYATGADENLTLYALSIVGCLLMVVGLKGTSMLRLDLKSIGRVFRDGWWVIVVSIGLVGFELISSSVDGSFSIEGDGMLGRLGYLTVFCLLIGIFEELAFRVLCFEGFLAAFGSTKKGIMACVLVSSLLFGMAHVDVTAIDLAVPITLVESVLKILQTGVYAVFLAAMLLRERNFWGCALLHGFDDFLLLIPSFVLMGEEFEAEYVTTGEDAIAYCLLYVFMILLYIPVLIKGIKVIHETPAPDFGCLRPDKHESAGSGRGKHQGVPRIDSESDLG